MRSALRWMVRVVACCLAAACILSPTGSGAEPSAPPSRNVTLEDILQMGGFGTVMFDPTGRWLAFEQIRPYDQIADYSYRSYAFAKSGHQIWIKDLSSEQGPILLPGLDPGPHSYLVGFSPSGRYLSFLQYDSGTISLGISDVEAGRVVLLPDPPEVSRGGDYVPVWTEDEKIVFTALQPGQMPIETSLRARVGAELSAAWAGAWRGDTVTAREVRTLPRGQGRIASRGRLVMADPATGNVSELYSEGVSGVRLSPEGHLLAGVIQERGGASSAGALVLIDPVGGASTALVTEMQFEASSLVWHPGGRFLAAYGRPNGDTARPAGFVRVDPVSGNAEAFDTSGLVLLSEQARGWLDRPERAVFLGQRLAVYARPEGAEQSGETASPGWFALSVGAPPEQITPPGEKVSPVPAYSGGEALVVQGEGSVTLYSIDGSAEPLLALPDASVRLVQTGTIFARKGLARPPLTGEALFAISRGSFREAVFTGEYPGDAIVRRLDLIDNAALLAGSVRAGAAASLLHWGFVTELVLSRTGRPPEVVARVNTHLDAAAAGDWRAASYHVEWGGKSVRLESCILLPQGLRPDRPPPLVVDIYPGAAPDCLDPDRRPLSYPDPGSPYIWAAQGFAYSRISLPAELLTDEDSPMGRLPDLVLAGVDAHVAAGWADPDQVILHGFSMGAIAALQTAAEGEGYQAVIARHGWMDPYSHYFGTPGTISLIDDGYFGAFARYESGGLFAKGATPFEDVQAYLRASPLYAAERINMPVLLIASDLDTFDIGQADAMYAALLRTGKDAVYVRYLGEGHGLSSPANIRDMWERTFGFLAERGISP